MIQWTTATSGHLLTNSWSSFTVTSSSYTKTSSATGTQTYIVGTISFSQSSSESASASRGNSVTTGANTLHTFSTYSSTLASAWASASGLTQTFLFDETSDNTTFIYTDSDQSNGNESSSGSTTGGLTGVFVQSKMTSTITTASATRFSPVSSSSDLPLAFVSYSASDGLVATTTSDTDGTDSNNTWLTTVSTSRTYWFVDEQSTQSNVDDTTMLTETESGVRSATIYQAVGNEVLYAVASANYGSFEPAPVAARALGASFSRITVGPNRNTETLQSTVVTDLANTTTTETVPALSQSTKVLSRFGSLGQSSTETMATYVTTTATATCPMNYEFSTSSSFASDTQGDGVSESETQYSETSVFSAANRFARTPWVPSVIAGSNAGTSQDRYGKSGWIINGSTGSTTTINTAGFSFTLEPITGSHRRGHITMADVSRAQYTINVPSVIYNTTVGGSATTSSRAISVTGSATPFSEVVTEIEHFGGGPFASDWTIVDRPYPFADYAYRDMVANSTTSYFGHDTSRGYAESAVVSHLTFEPHLLGGGEPDGQQLGVDKVYWVESRNDPDPA